MSTKDVRYASTRIPSYAPAVPAVQAFGEPSEQHINSSEGSEALRLQGRASMRTLKQKGGGGSFVFAAGFLPPRVFCRVVSFAPQQCGLTASFQLSGRPS